MDDYDDSYLDNLPPNTLQDLEDNALLSTQAPLNGPTKNANGPTRAFSGLHLGDQNITEIKINPDSDFEGEDVIDLDAQAPVLPAFNNRSYQKTQDQATQREAWRQQRYGVPSKLAKKQNGVNGYADSQRGEPKQAPQVGQQRSALHLPQSREAVQHSRLSVGEDQDAQGLQRRILQLEAEQVKLRQEAEDARATVMSKAGEISIVRANHGKSTKEFERRIAELQQSHNAEIAKQRAELDAARKERERMETNNKFLEHDLAQETERVRHTRKSLRDGTGNAGRSVASGSPLSTPKKMRSLPFRDGFDDDEVLAISPRLKDKTKPATPKAGSKRKRSNVQGGSPSQPLPIVDQQGSPYAAQVEEGFHSFQDDEPVSALTISTKQPPEQKFDFLQSVLDHRSQKDGRRTFEVFTSYALPSNPNTHFSSLFLDEAFQDSLNKSSDAFREDFCNKILQMWNSCLEENYHLPLYDLKELLQYILIISPTALSIRLVPLLTSLSQSTADLVALPLAKASVSSAVTSTPFAELKNQVNPSEYLDLMQLVATNCEDNSEDLRQLWSHIQFDFVLLMLHRAQPPHQIRTMLQLLISSILPTSFGAISRQTSHSVQSDASSKQSQNETNLLNRLTVLLYDVASQPPSSEASETLETESSSTLLANRVLVLQFLKNLCQTDHGGHALATHRLVIGRLVRFLHDCIISLYAYDPSTHSVTSQLVNDSVMILSHLTEHFREAIDLRARLAAVQGASHKHLVALSRVAFAEGVSVIEEGIRPEVSEMAHKMLDEHLSPEEGEAVVEVFSSGR